MSDDIVIQLRDLAELLSPENTTSEAGLWLICDKGAAEIERLHERCDAYKGQVKCGSEEISRLRLQLADAEATLFKLNSGEELQSLMKLNNELRSQLEKKSKQLAVIADDLRDNYPAVDVTTVVFSGDWAGVGCCVIPQDRILEIISALSDEASK